MAKSSQHIETQQSEFEQETCCFLQDLEVSETWVILAKLVVFLVDMFRIHEILQQEREGENFPTLAISENFEKYKNLCAHTCSIYCIYRLYTHLYGVIQIFVYSILNDQKLIDHRPNNGALCTGYEETTTQCWSPLKILQVWFSNME